MTNAKPVELQREDLVGKLWAMHGIAQSSSDGFTYLNDAARVVISEAAALISQLTAERDFLRDDVKRAQIIGEQNVAIMRDRAETAEKRAKELEEGRGLDKVVLDEGIEIINELESSNKLLSERVAVLEAGLTRLASPEAFDVPRMANKEEQARMRYADDVLRRARTGLEGK